MEKYCYTTGVDEIKNRVENGQIKEYVINEVTAKWTPGNEYMWSEYDIFTLIDNPQKKSLAVNNMLHRRIIIYRNLLAFGIDIRGIDPFTIFEDSSKFKLSKGKIDGIKALIS